MLKLTKRRQKQQLQSNLFVEWGKWEVFLTMENIPLLEYGVDSEEEIL